jgi:Cytochrome C oxidase, cbb3-type, subunit III
MRRILAWTTLGVLLWLNGCERKAPTPQQGAAAGSAGAVGSADTSATPAPGNAPAPARPSEPSRVPAPGPAPAPVPSPPARAVTRPSAPAPSAVPKVTQPAPDTPPLRDIWHPPPHDTLDNETYQGWKQFELNCSRCHGEYAVGTSFAPALVESLKEGGSIPTKQAFITTVCAGRPDKGMPSWCALGLEMATIERIYLYVKGRADGRISAGRPALREP